MERNTITIREALLWARKYLKNLNISDAEISSELLLNQILGLTRNELYLNYDRTLSESKLQRYKEYIKQRANGKPIDYILKESVFMGLKFKINNNTLIPRSETEILVEKAIKYLKMIKNSFVLELGSGSGNISISISKFTDSKVVAIEKSDKAIEVAKENILKYSLNNKITLIKGDMFNPLNNNFKKEFDCLISNPPYVSDIDYDSLPLEVQQEPKTALIAGADGLDYIREIIKTGPEYVKNGGRIYIEIGYDQKEKVETILKTNKLYSYEFVRDYSGIYRIVIIKL